MAAATLSLIVLSGAPAAYATDLPDVPVAVSLPSTVTSAAGVGYSYECTMKSSIVRGEENAISSQYCVVAQADQVWGTLDFAAPDYGAGRDVFYDLYTYRCRQSDNVCVVIASRTGRGVTNSAGYFSITTEPTTQTWAGRYYKTCAALSTELGWGYPEDCTLHLVP